MAEEAELYQVLEARLIGSSWYIQPAFGSLINKLLLHIFYLHHITSCDQTASDGQ